MWVTFSSNSSLLLSFLYPIRKSSNIKFINELDVSLKSYEVKMLLKWDKNTSEKWNLNMILSIPFGETGVGFMYVCCFNREGSSEY